MKPLPRPVKSVLQEAPDAGIKRVWAGIQRKRRLRPTVRPFFLFAGAAALAALAVVAWPRNMTPVAPPAIAPVAQAPVTPSQEEVAASAPSLAAAFPVSSAAPSKQGRRPGTSRPPLAFPGLSSAAQQPADAVGVLLKSADEAWQRGELEQVVTLLREISAHHGDDPRACAAVFVLGRVQLEALHDPNAALESFERAMELDPPEDLAVPLWELMERARGLTRRP